EPAATQLRERAGHLWEGPPRWQRLAERVLLAGGKNETFLRSEEREGLGQHLPVRDRPPILDARLQLVGALEEMGGGLIRPNPRQLAADPSHPVDERAVDVERGPTLR